MAKVSWLWLAANVEKQNTEINDNSRCVVNELTKCQLLLFIVIMFFAGDEKKHHINRRISWLWSLIDANT